MQLYGILRRNGWATAEDLQVAGARSAEVGDTPGSGVRWIRSYALAEESGEVGTFCVYEAESPEAIRKHAEDAGCPATRSSRSRTPSSSVPIRSRPRTERRRRPAARSGRAPVGTGLD